MTQWLARFEAIGTRWQIDADGVTFADWSACLEGIEARIEKFDQLYSRFRDDSLVSAMARRAGEYTLPGDAMPLLTFYKQLYDVTEGKVTPLIGRVVSDAGYDAKYSLRPQAVTHPPKWEEVISFTSEKLTLSQPALLDLGAAGKGYLIDIVGDLLIEAGIMNYCINAGGDILYRTVSPQTLDVGLENPSDASEVIGVAGIQNQSLCASAGSRRQWGQYHHIIDPESLTSPTEITATWVVADSAMMADGLATALFFTDPAVLQRQFTFSYAILHSDMNLVRSRDFPAKAFEAQV